MKIDLKKYRTEVYTYQSNLSAEVFVKELISFINETQKINGYFKLNMTGEMLSSSMFELWLKWRLGTSHNAGKSYTLLHGEIIPFNQVTKIVFSVSPHPFATVAAVLSVISGVVTFATFFTYEGRGYHIVLSLLLMFALPYLILNITAQFKEQLKTNFVTHFNLEES